MVSLLKCGVLHHIVYFRHSSRSVEHVGLFGNTSLNPVQVVAVPD